MPAITNWDENVMFYENNLFDDFEYSLSLETETFASLFQAHLKHC